MGLIAMKDDNDNHINIFRTLTHRKLSRVVKCAQNIHDVYFSHPETGRRVVTARILQARPRSGCVKNKNVDVIIVMVRTRIFHYESYCVLCALRELKRAERGYF